MDSVSLPEHSVPTLVAAVVAAAALMVVLTLLLRRSSTASPLLKDVIAGTRNLVVPFGVGWFLLTNLAELKQSSVSAKVAQTLFWVSVIWVGTALVKLLFFARAEGSTWRARVPGLFVNLTQVTLILVGAAMVIAGVWNQNLGALLATLGVGSLVVGLALQDTLGNLFAGVALLFERPFSTGDWVGIGKLQGQILNINWRAVRIVTRERDLHVVPNSVIGKEIIHNYSQPSKAHGLVLRVGFSYDDPPNEIKRMLRGLCADVEGILAWGISIRTIGYQDFSIEYEVRFFIDDYLREPEIREDYMTRIWYATRRNGFTIPFPIRTVHHRELPPREEPDVDNDIRETLGRLPLFHVLSPEELRSLSERAARLEFATGDAIVREGEPGDSMYVIAHGSVAVTQRRSSRKGVRHLAELHKGAHFGEMGLLTGEPRSASVIAKTDTVALMIPHTALSVVLEERPKLAESFAAVVEERRRTHDDPTDFDMQADDHDPNAAGIGLALVGKIRAFFGLRGDDDS